ncbi:MAG: endonuclease/exonuclease/phosphatase family protein [Albidovulum sp.]
MAALLASPATADTFRIATYNADLTREGPGLLLRDILTGTDPQVEAAAAVVAATHPDVLVLTGIDYDYGSKALSAFAARVRAAGGPDYPNLLALRPNTGMATGLDLDGDGRLGGPGDAQGFGAFSGQGGMAILSRLPVDGARAQDYSAFLWRDLPGALVGGAGLGDEALAVQRLSTTGHWAVPIILPGGKDLTLLAWLATPPVFDGPEDRNGRRNHDEAAFWQRLLDGDLPWPAPPQPFVILGDAELDPMRAEGRRGALMALLSDARLQSPLPPGTPTADFRATGGPGPLQLDYVLPSASLGILGAGVVAPRADDQTVFAASRHRLVWVDLDLPAPAAP